jgi:integrase
MAERGCPVNTDLRKAAADYLRLRRSFGYKLADHDWLIAQFLDHIAETGSTTITVGDALAFAQIPATTSRRWHATRLDVIRGFSAFVHASDPDAAQLIPPGLIYARVSRRIPYLYSEEQIRALMSRAEVLRPAMFGATMSTFIGLIAATGIRSGEAIKVDIEDLSSDRHVMTVTGKCGRKRLVPLHSSTVAALNGYLLLRGTAASAPRTGPLFVGCRGARLNKNTARAAFRQVTDAADLPASPGAAPPRLHDFRHTFAVNSVIDAHRQGGDIDARIAALATYLGHVDPGNTYWYLTASPELMVLVMTRMSADWGGQRR